MVIMSGSYLQSSRKSRRKLFIKKRGSLPTQMVYIVDNIKEKKVYQISTASIAPVLVVLFLC